MRVQQHPRDVDRRLSQGWRRAVDQRQELIVARHQVGRAVGDHGRVRSVAIEDPIEGAEDRVELRIVEARLGIGRCVAGGEQHRVALAQWDLERLGEPHDHPATGERASALDKADVALRRSGAQGELELADTPALAPVAERVGDRCCLRVRRHRRIPSARGSGWRFPAGNCGGVASDASCGSGSSGPKAKNPRPRIEEHSDDDSNDRPGGALRRDVE